MLVLGHFRKVSPSHHKENFEPHVTRYKVQKPFVYVAVQRNLCRLHIRWRVTRSCQGIKTELFPISVEKILRTCSLTNLIGRFVGVLL